MADERTYYCFCADNCKFETMTKEQIIAAIVQAVESGTVQDIDAGFITKIKETGTNGTLTFWKGTEAEFNALSPAVTASLVMARIDEDGKVYLCTNDTTMDTFLENTAAAAEARALAVIGSKQDLHKSTRIVLSASKWDTSSNGYFAEDDSVVSGDNLSDVVTNSNTVFVFPNEFHCEKWNRFGIRCLQQVNGLLVFYCDTIPDVDISVSVVSLSEVASTDAVPAASLGGTYTDIEEAAAFQIGGSFTVEKEYCYRSGGDIYFRTKATDNSTLDGSGWDAIYCDALPENALLVSVKEICIDANGEIVNIASNATAASNADGNGWQIPSVYHMQGDSEYSTYWEGHLIVIG